jgi:hypothetical protein
MEGRARTFLWLAVGGALAIVFNGFVASLLNKVLSPIGLQYT